MTGRKVAILAADGVNAAELQAVKAALGSVGITPEVVAPALGSVKGAAGEDVPVDRSFLSTASVMYDGLYVPGGSQAIDALKKARRRGALRERGLRALQAGRRHQRGHWSIDGL